MERQDPRWSLDRRDAGTRGYCELLKGAPAATLGSLLARQSEATDGDPVATLRRAVRSLSAGFAEPGALERTVHHRVDMPGSQLLALWIGDAVVHSWDLATAIGVDPGLDDQLAELVYGFYAPRAEGDALYINRWFAAPTRPLRDGAIPLERLIHLVGR